MGRSETRADRVKGVVVVAARMMTLTVLSPFLLCGRLDSALEQVSRRENQNSIEHDTVDAMQRS